MLKSQIISEISSFYKSVGTPVLVESPDNPPNVNNYRITVMSSGFSEANKKPVAYYDTVYFCVYEEGQPGEEAFYMPGELENKVNKDITGDNTLLAVNKIYESEEMRKRVQAAVAKSAQDIINEAIPSSFLTGTASAGQPVVSVQAGYLFWVGKVVVLSDNSNSETLTVKSISDNNVTMTTNLANSYTVAQDAVLTYEDNSERLVYASNAMLDPDTFTKAMAQFVALNPTIQSSGGLATDSDILYVVNSNITKLAIASLIL